MTTYALPKWEPKDRAAPLKDEYLQFHKEVTRYHDRVEGNLMDFPTLLTQLSDVPDPLDAFTDKMAVVLGATDLQLYVADVRALFDKAQRKRIEHATPPATVSGLTDTDWSALLKVALPTQFDRLASNACTFLSECTVFMRLNRTRFTDDSIKIQWALQLCSGKAANWKRIQLELLEAFDVPEHLTTWGLFQEEFRQTWADLHTRNRAQQRILNGLKQTGSVR